MVRRNSGAILRQIHALLSAGTFSGLSDRQLLERFIACHDEVSELAFTVLVERHGPMVLGVCHRILADPHDAEDAFQATFLVLVRKAGSIRVNGNGSVGRWLFGVATRVAVRARADARRRRARERSVLDRLEIQAGEPSIAAVDQAELQSILAEELGKLPARLQAAIVLCDLEGSSHEEAARQLGWPVGTVKSRLSRGRARLRERLMRRGLAPPGLSITMSVLPAALPRGLVEATARAAQSLITGRMAAAGIVAASVTTLTEGVLQTMFLTKFKLAAAAMILIMTGSAVLMSQTTAQKPLPRSGTGDHAVATSRGTDEAATREDELDVVLLERAWVDAIPRRDTAVVNRIMADDFEGIDPVGNIFTKATYMPDLAHGVFSAEPIELDEIKTRIFGDTAVATSRIKIAGYATRGRMTNVYVKRRGRWQCVASHVSGLAAGGAGPAGGTPMSGEKAADFSVRQTRRIAVPPPQPVVAIENSCIACHSVAHGAGIPSVRREDAGSAAAAGPKPDSVVDEAHHGTASWEQAHIRAMARPDQVKSIRVRFPSLVEKVHVKVGQAVKKGQPLIDLFGTELADAKSHYEIARLQWTRDRKVLDYKKPLADSNTLPKKELIDVENDEAQSRLKMKLAKDKLFLYGLTEPEIEIAGTEDGERRARLTFRSPVDGTIIQVGAERGKVYDIKSVLLTIDPASSAGGPRPAGQ
jgi:RNA polymerase sigma factor (sigma-70 family)